jgi:hypothetical protein
MGLRYHQDTSRRLDRWEASEPSEPREAKEDRIQFRAADERSNFVIRNDFVADGTPYQPTDRPFRNLRQQELVEPKVLQ